MRKVVPHGMRRRAISAKITGADAIPVDTMMLRSNTAAQIDMVKEPECALDENFFIKYGCNAAIWCGWWGRGCVGGVARWAICPDDNLSTVKN